MEVDGQRHAPAALPPGKTRHPLYRRLRGPQGRTGWVLKISPPPGFDPRIVQPVASHYTDWVIPAHLWLWVPLLQLTSCAQSGGHCSLTFSFWNSLSCFVDKFLRKNRTTLRLSSKLLSRVMGGQSDAVFRRRLQHYVGSSSNLWCSQTSSQRGWGCGSIATQIEIKKNPAFICMVISDVLHDLHFSWKQLQKLADDQHIGVLENKIENLDFDKVKEKEAWTWWFNP